MQAKAYGHVSETMQEPAIEKYLLRSRPTYPTMKPLCHAPTQSVRT
jgi:hypothetical protein